MRKAEYCMHARAQVRIHSSIITVSTRIWFGMIAHHPEVSAISEFVTSLWRHTQE